MKAFFIKLFYIAGAIALFTTSCQSGSESKTEQKESSQEKVMPSMELHAAVFMGNAKALQEHIDYGSDLNARDAYGSTPLNIACTFGKTALAQQLIDAGADVNALNADGGTSLHTAAFFCRTKLVKALLTAGVDQTIKNQYGATALESVSSPWEIVEPIYIQMRKDLGGLGLRLDFEELKSLRPVVTDILKTNSVENE